MRAPTYPCWLYRQAEDGTIEKRVFRSAAEVEPGWTDTPAQFQNISQIPTGCQHCTALRAQVETLHHEHVRLVAEHTDLMATHEDLQFAHSELQKRAPAVVPVIGPVEELPVETEPADDPAVESDPAPKSKRQSRKPKE